MDLSVIIVSYNVLPFLKQCIQSVKEASKDIECEILIIDNASEDGSANYLSQINGDSVKVILNPDNTGYGTAMNQGIREANGTYILLLNPDTIITQEAVSLSMNRLMSDVECGAVGVRMMDGHGNYLKESKRGYPTPRSSFFKLSGLSGLFPRSERFADYYQGHLNANENHRIDILTGAYLMTRTKLIKNLGGFDERYFMYGEDIDLSHSIMAAGYHNYYIGEASIIHFKGESTRKESLKNTYHFYNSMLLFTKKYSRGNVFFIGLLSVLLILIGALRWGKLNVMPYVRPVLRYVVYVLTMYLTSKAWASFYFEDSSYFNYQRHAALIMIYAMILSVGYYLGGRKVAKLQNLIWATIVVLVIYSLLPLYLRSSRAVILLGSGSIILLESALQAWISWRNRGKLAFWNQSKRALLLGSFDQCHEILDKLKSQQSYEYAGIVSQEINDQKDCITSFDHLENYLAKHSVDTMTMHMESMSMDRIMTIMSSYGADYQYLLYSSENNSIIDSPDSRTQGTVSLVEIRWAIASPVNRAVKRSIDIFTSISFIFFIPVLIWFVDQRIGWISNIYGSLVGKTSWVGYSDEDSNLDQLPKLKPAVLKLHHEPGNGHFENVAYARDYTYLKDISVIFNSITALGNTV